MTATTRERTIMAIGGAVVKTASDLLMEVVKQQKIDCLVHNGGSIFHDFQLATELEKLGSKHSYLLDELLRDFYLDESSSIRVLDWIFDERAPKSSITDEAQKRGIPVFMFTVLGGDFWQLFSPHDWGWIGNRIREDFYSLSDLMRSNFHYICMGSAVVHPEVFIKIIALNKPTNFRTTVVDFKEMYRPLTRVAKYGEYRHCTHRQYLEEFLDRSER